MCYTKSPDGGSGNGAVWMKDERAPCKLNNVKETRSTRKDAGPFKQKCLEGPRFNFFEANG